MPRRKEKVECWFDLKDDPFEGRVLVLSLDDEEKADIREQVEKSGINFDPERGAVEQRTEIRTILDRKLTAAKRIGGWENFYGSDGKPMECNAENKHFWACDDDFFKELKGYGEEVDKMAQEKLEAAIKN